MVVHEIGSFYEQFLFQTSNIIQEPQKLERYNCASGFNRKSGDKIPPIVVGS